MDLNLPDGCGLDFIKDIRSKTDVPLLIVSSEQDTARKILTFESGADDFVSTPLFQCHCIYTRLDWCDKFATIGNGNWNFQNATLRRYCAKR